MSFPTSFYYEAVNTGAISALISTRFYSAGAVEQAEALPYATYQIIDSVPRYHQGGNLDLNATRVQVNFWAATMTAAEVVREAFVTAFEEFRGDMGESGSTVDVKLCYVASYNDLSEAPSDGTQGGPVGEAMDLIFHHAT